MQFYSPRRSTLRFAALVACVSITLGTVIATPQITGAATFGDVWAEIVRVLSPGSPNRRTAGGKGGDNIVSPGVWVNDAAKPVEVWSLRPVILYETSGRRYQDPVRIELQQDEKTIQSFDLKDHPQYRKLAIETDLKPGQKYEIHEFIHKSKDSTGAPIEFVVMPDSPERRAIADQLANVDDEFAKDDAKRSTGRIEVFVKAGLWSDALQEATTLVETEKDWQFVKTEIIDRWNENERKKAAEKAEAEKAKLAK
jgi:hypothetical protein